MAEKNITPKAPGSATKANDHDLATTRVSKGSKLAKKSKAAKSPRSRRAPRWRRASSRSRKPDRTILSSDGLGSPGPVRRPRPLAARRAMFVRVRSARDGHASRDADDR